MNIPIFFSCDENYVPFLAVTINSIEQNMDPNTNYDIYVLAPTIGEKFKLIKEMEKPNVHIEFISMNERVKEYAKEFDDVRDYYTQAIFYRLFIAELFPNLTKSIYIDCDIVLLTDIKKLYDIDLEGKVLGVIVDDVVNNNLDFQKYVVEAIGAHKDKYFNSGVLLMDLVKYREEEILEKFLYLLKKYNFKSVAPDQDYLNYLCRDLVKYLPISWNRMPVDDDYDGEINLIHYNMFMKPWRYDIRYDEHFWKYAEGTKFLDEIRQMKESYSEENRKKDLEGVSRMVKMVHDIMDSHYTFVDLLDKGIDHGTK